MKLERHSKIVELIGKYEIETQEELADYLNQAGFAVTQATVSRDIRELKLTKVQSESGKQRYMVLQNQSSFSDKYIRILRDGYMSMDMAQNILVIKTVSGMAMAVAATLLMPTCLKKSALGDASPLNTLRMVSGLMPTPPSVMDMTRAGREPVTAAFSARITIFPAHPFGSIPWNRAFSTRGCRVKR